MAFIHFSCTLELLRSLPKTDLHCRFACSAPPEWLWTELHNEFGNDHAKVLEHLRSVGFGESVVDLPSLTAELQRAAVNEEHERRCKSVSAFFGSPFMPHIDTIPNALFDFIVFLVVSQLFANEVGSRERFEHHCSQRGDFRRCVFSLPSLTAIVFFSYIMYFSLPTKP